LKTSSTFSPDKADTSTETGIFEVEAQFDASTAETSRPSGATEALSCDPSPRVVLPELFEATDDPPLKGKDCDGFEPMLDGVPDGNDEGWISASIKFPVSAKSSLFPTNMQVRFGEANARASFIKEGRAVKVLCAVISYTRIAPAAPR
jgi:hypothetical protein